MSRILGDGKPHVTSCFHSAHLVFALFYVSLGLVIHVQAGKGHDDTNCLYGVNGLGEPEDGDADDCDAFDQGSDRVSDRGCGCEDYKSDDVLGKVYGAVEEEVVYDGVDSGSPLFIVTPEVGVVFGGVVCGHELWKIVIEPNGDHEDEGGTRGIE